jgi:S1-C subfamily serine protease
MVSDAITISYLKLYKNKSFTANSKLNTDYAIKDNALTISAIADADRVSNKKDAFQATVIVKTKENDKDAGHGSGFAISKDGYVLTNYHVIAGENSSKQKEIVVITADGTELKAKIVRFNKFRDVALLKVENTFAKAFYLDNQNKADVMLDVYTIGAPKSIELGQSVSAGIISSMRDVNDNKYLQLGMSINGGNSGGAIFDTNGNLHGVVVSKLIGKNTEGVAFAIPSYMVANYLNLNAR